MNYPGILLSPSDPASIRPWHPETLLDLENVNPFKELPTQPLGVRQQTLVAAEGYKPTGQILAGNTDFVKKEMKRLFLNTPGVSFYRGSGEDSYQIHVYSREAEPNE